MKFCPAFMERMKVGRSISRTTEWTVTSYGFKTAVIPFIWPVTRWGANDRYNCKTLVARYNYAGAQAILDKARRALSGKDATPLGNARGPFLLTQRQWGDRRVGLFDLSRAPVVDYGRWVTTAAERLSRPPRGASSVIRPAWRDRVRAYVFESVSAWEPLIKSIVKF